MTWNNFKAAFAAVKKGPQTNAVRLFICAFYTQQTAHTHARTHARTHTYPVAITSTSTG